MILRKGDLILVSTKGSIDKRTFNTLAIVVGHTKDGYGELYDYTVIEFNHTGQRTNKWSIENFRGKYMYGESLAKRRAMKKRYDECGRLSFSEDTPYRGIFFPLAEWCTLIERANTLI